MKTPLRTLFAFAALATTAFATVQPAQAITVRNCTGDVIRVNIYNNDDALRVIPKFGGKLGPGATGRVNTGGPSFVKVFRAQVIDKMMIERGGLSNNGSYIVTPGYGLRPGSSCR